MQNSFEVDFSKLSLSSEEESKLIKLPFDRSLKSKLETVGLAEFWLHISNDYTVLSEGNKCFVAIYDDLSKQITVFCYDCYQNKLQKVSMCPIICDSVCCKYNHA